MAEFTLYIGNKCFSSWSLRPWVAMRHLEIPFEESFVRLRTPETAANLAKVSPTGLVPVLNHNSRIVWETLAILEYLADLFPEKKLWPEDASARALARSVATEMHSGFREVRYGWPMNLRRPKAYKPLDAEGEAQRARIEAIWRQCREQYGKDGPFLFGHFTAADAMYAPVVTRFDTYGGELAPVARAYVDTVLATPAMRHWYAEAAKEPWPEPGPHEQD
ncbi:glutathione S-transferase family protein [Mesorhizobium captivum]|uniref:glutathione S-transferase family protein n=1 Tax=Mesorhizobium captivum TaxID=3072319 RepID=UPI002A241FC7|nr:glutathione S-transferase family protein [Mesorhizobium sp. VK23E]MDX8515020.1 glutathione S-transferase family protein [Mesorhizobium sp. VK23E]